MLTYITSVFISHFMLCKVSLITMIMRLSMIANDDWETDAVI